MNANQMYGKEVYGSERQDAEARGRQEEKTQERRSGAFVPWVAVPFALVRAYVRLPESS